jgi:O-antigen ligase
MRILFLYGIVVMVGLYAWRDWYKSLCGLVVLMAVLEHPDMPKTMFGIQGLNLWNVLLVVIILAWLTQRTGERLTWDLPQACQVLLICFLLVIATACVRLIEDRHALVTDPSLLELVSEYFVNPVKFILPGILLFEGCRNRSRFLWGLISTLSLYLLLSVQVIRWMPLAGLLDPSTLAGKSHKILRAEVGYFRVDLSVMLAGASWALLAAQPLVVATRRRALMLAGALLIIFAQALTAGRSGYVAWVATGLSLSLLKWPRYLLLAPVIALVIALLPGISGRVFEGVRSSNDMSSSADVDVETLTAGRNNIWPAVIEKIGEAPIVGYGRQAMQRIGLSTAIEGEEFVTHPHNAYLEMLLENGWLGLAVVLSLFGYILAQSFSLTRDVRSPVFVAIGAVTTSLVIAQLAGSITAQSFYPREGTVGMWCAIGLMLRVSVERAGANLSFATRDREALSVTPAPPLEWWRRPASSQLPRAADARLDLARTTSHITQPWR